MVLSYNRDMERLYDYFCQKHYAINIDINADKTRFDAVAVITGKAKAETIKLHAVKLRVKEVKVDGRVVDCKRKDDMLTFSKMPVGKAVRIEVSYSAPITADMQGVYLSTYKSDSKTEKIVATQFESHYARECFPCVDEPAAKATFDLMISSAKPTDTILANMPVKSEKLSDDKKTVIFERTPKMSTYLVAFAVGNFVGCQVESKHGVQITAYAGLHQKT